MHFIKSTVALFGLATSAYSYCIEVPDKGETGPQIPFTANAKTVTPSVISQWSASTVKYNVTFGMISVYNGQDTSSSSVLLTFGFPSDSKGKTCEFNLYLERWAQVCPQGSAPSNAKCSGTFALYSSLEPAKAGAASNKRNQWIGVLKAETSNMASWVSPSSKPQKIACPTGTAGFELVPQGDFDYIYFPWSPGAKSLPSFTYG